MNEADSRRPPETGREAEDQYVRLTAEHGCGVKVNAAGALRILGQRGRVHPADVLAFAYRDQPAAQAWTAANAGYGLPSLGTRDTTVGIIVVLDLRPSLIAGGSPVTPPGYPDSYRPSGRELRRPGTTAGSVRRDVRDRRK